MTDPSPPPRPASRPVPPRVRPVPPPLSPAAGVDPLPPDLPTPAEGEPRFLRHEAHLRAIAVWSMALGGLMTMSGGTALMGSVIALPATSSMVGGVRGVLVNLGGLLWGGALLAAGYGLWGLSSWGRQLYLPVAVVGILISLGALLKAFPGGSSLEGVLFAPILIAWFGSTLWAVFRGPSERIFTDEYRALAAPAERTSRPPILRSPFFWAPIVGMLLFAIGYMILLVLFFISPGKIC